LGSDIVIVLGYWLLGFLTYWAALVEGTQLPVKIAHHAPPPDGPKKEWLSASVKVCGRLWLLSVQQATATNEEPKPKHFSYFSCYLNMLGSVFSCPLAIFIIFIYCFKATKNSFLF
jgi:hypothetical protein